MSLYRCDLHIHSCLSPCGDDDMTPANIVGMAMLNGLQIVALTDHNSTKNCPAFFKLAKGYGLIPVAGVELTTSEDVHAVCLFRDLETAMEFDRFIESRRIQIKNNPDISEEDKKFIFEQLMANFNGECAEVGMYLCMARIAHREGYPEVGLYWEKAAFEEAEHAAKFAELLGELVTDSTKKNLEMRVEAENGATLGKFELAKMAKEQNLDAIHDTVHEMARDEARHGKAFEGLLKRYFG